MDAVPFGCHLWQPKGIDMSEKLLRRPEVLRTTGIGGTSTLYDWMARGEFPRPVKLGARAVAWRESDVLAWIEARRVQPSGAAA